MERKLASVQRVLAIEPIANADAIELARINGWQCVVKKGEFSPGDPGVYFELDAVPPDTGNFQFLWTPKGAALGSVTRPASARIRTIRLRGTLSQGLLLPLNRLGVDASTPEGTDLTARLGVGKYEPPLPAGMGEARAPFPGLVPKTDEMRVQSMLAVIEELRGLPYVITQKCDGTSSTFLIDPRDGEFHACGRNWSIADGDNAYWSVARKYGLVEKLRAHAGRYAIQGEICGPGVQANPLGLPSLTWLGFSAFDLVERRFLGHDEFAALTTDLQVPIVPVIETGPSFAHDLASLLLLAEGVYPGTANEREGVVVRPLAPRPSEALGSRLSFKVISNRYLLKERD